MDHRSSIRPETAADRIAADALIEAAFGPGRVAKAAERLREGQARPAVALVAQDDGRLSGVVRLWPVHIGETPALFLGPIAVDTSARGVGLGKALIEAACQAAAQAGWALVLLVGDPAWFQSGGFSAEAAGAVIMPGPVDRRRVLVRELVSGAAEGLAGDVRPG